MQYPFSTIASVTRVVSTLENYGIAVIPDFLNKMQLKGLNAEFEQILSNNSNRSGYKKIDYSNGRGAILTLKNSKLGDFHAVKEVFNSDFMREVTDQFLGKDAGLNTEIFVVNDVIGTSHHANNLHFDVVPTFKFFLYLTNTTSENGAFSCVPGSHRKTINIREKLGDKISYKNRELSRDLPATEDEVISIEGKAGTLIVFTTETFHRAGRVSSGERKVMRGHCRLPKDIRKEPTDLVQKVKSLFQKLGLN